MRQIGYATAPARIGGTSSANRIQPQFSPVTASYCPQIGGLMRFIVNAFPDGTGRLIFASNQGSTGTMAMPHTIRPRERAGNSGRLSTIPLSWRGRHSRFEKRRRGRGEQLGKQRRRVILRTLGRCRGWRNECEAQEHKQADDSHRPSLVDDRSSWPLDVLA